MKPLRLQWTERPKPPAPKRPRQSRPWNHHPRCICQLCRPPAPGFASAPPPVQPKRAKRTAPSVPKPPKPEPRARAVERIRATDMETAAAVAKHAAAAADPRLAYFLALRAQGIDRARAEVLTDERFPERT